MIRHALACLLILPLAVGISAQGNTLDKEKAKLAKLEKAYLAAKSAFGKDKKNAAKKKAYVQATVAYGTATMNSPALAPKDKYPKALRLYREALAIDPKNAEAKENKATIEGIYRSMGRPIPK